MDSVTSENLNKLALLIFEKTGLSRCVPSIQDEIEEQIEGSYTRLNKDEDEDDSNSTPYYGGVVYHRFKAVDDGKLCYQLDSELSNSEKKLFERFIQDNSLDISVERTDFSGQKWSFNLLIPFVLNKQESESFELRFRIKVTGFRTPYEIEAHTLSEVTEDEISKMLIMYSLQI